MAYMAFQLGAEYAVQLDQQDPLQGIRQRFYLREGEIYMDGNSLGLCSKDAEACVLHMLEAWKTEGIRIWNMENSKFFMYPSILGDRMAELIGAEGEEVTVTNSATINIHQCLSTFYKPAGQRHKILVDELNFPTDRYAVDSQVRLKGYDPETAVMEVVSRDGRMIEEEDIIAAMDESVAVALLPAVLYRSAQLLDMRRVTKAAHEKGILIGWDFCHSIGAVPHDLKAVDADFAIWCTYKYLSAGPGSIAGLYVNKKHFGTTPGLAGWFGNAKETQFQLRQKHEPAPDADAFLTGTSPLLSMAALEGTLNIFRDAGMERVREKSLHITAYLMYLIDTRLTQYGYTVGTPREDSRRGGHVSLEHGEAFRICLALKSKGVIPDFREPNVVRLAPTALYNTYSEVYRLVDILEEIARDKLYEQFSDQRALVN